MFYKDRLEKLKYIGLERVIGDRGGPQGAHIEIEGRALVNFGSNDYLGLANNPKTARAASEAALSMGAGAGAARLLAGGSILYKELEERFARYKGCEAGLLFSSGYAANTGAIPALMDQGDVIFSDALNHASIIDACRLSRAEVFIYKHRNTAHLEELIATNARDRRAMIITDTVFSMDGDIAPLPDLARVARKHGALLYLDEAHATGVIGDGRGGLAHFQMKAEPYIVVMGTLSKALGSAGACVAGSAEVIEWLTHSARSFIFSTALPPPAVAAALKALEMLETGDAPISRLWENREHLASALRSNAIDIGESETPIIPIICESSGAALSTARELMDHGIYAPAIRPPSVKEPRIRITVTAGHTAEDIHALVRGLLR